MPMFMSEEDFRQCSGDTGMVAERADAYIRQLLGQIETVRAEADATSITPEQNCSLIEQKYVSLSAACSAIQSRQHQLLLQSIEKDGEIERLKREASEVHNSKRQLMELMEQKDLELKEKNATIKSYLDKIYKSIAQVSEEALKQIELTHENYRNEADEAERSLESEFHSLRERVSELESACKLKNEEAVSATAGREEALAGALSEMASLKDDCSVKLPQIELLESQISALRGDLEREHHRWRTAQDNCERQVILQSETIQELTKTSQALDSAQTETSELSKVVDQLKTENSHLKYLNKRGVGSGSSSQSLAADDGFQSVLNYLRRCKEISDTELSLSKQEKLRLHSQLDIALKSAEAAQASLQAGREKSREEEFKSLQFKIRELTLQLELESCRREIDALKVEKADPQKKIDELMEKYKDFDIDDYNRLKESCHQMEVNIRGKDALLEEFQKLVSEKENTILNLEKLLSERQDALSRFERDLAEIVVELSDRESRITEISKNEASLKSELKKARRLNHHIRRSCNKEKEELGKEVQALSKQLENSAMEQAVKENETQMQILEKTLERLREDLKRERENRRKEKEKTAKMRNTIMDAREHVIQRQTNLTDELSKHNQALRALQDEVNKLRNDQSQIISSTILEGFASAYNQAVENFKQKTQQFCGEPDSKNTEASAEAPIVQTSVLPTVSNVPEVDDASEKLKGTEGDELADTDQVPESSNVASLSQGGPVLSPEGVGKPVLPGNNTSTVINLTERARLRSQIRLAGMDSSVDRCRGGRRGRGPDSQAVENFELTAQQITTGSSCKRPSTLSHSDLPEETTADVLMPLLKKSKPSGGEEEGNEEPPEVAMAVEESMAKAERDEAERNELEEEQKVDVVSSTQGGPTLSPGNNTSTTINLTERSRLGSRMSHAVMDHSVGGSPSRGRGRVEYDRHMAL